MLEKDPWSHTPHDGLTASCDGDTVKDMASLAFDDARMSSHCLKSSNITSNNEFGTDDDVLNGTFSAADSNSCAYQLSHVPQTDDHNFFTNNCEDKESIDFLYNGWPDMGNFEDVDRMLRRCDSSLGLGVTGNDDEMGWFTVEYPIAGPEEVLTRDFKFPCSQPSALTNMSQDYESPESNNKSSSYVIESKDEFKLKNQVSLQKKQSKHNQTEGKKASQCLGHDGLSYYIRDLKNNDIQISSVDESDQVFTSMGKWQQKRNLGLISFGYMENNTYLHPNYGHTPNQTTATVVKSENKGLTSPSPKESSYASYQVHSMESSGDPPLQGTVVKVDDRRKVHQSHGFQTSFTGSPRQTGMMLQSSKCDLVSAQKQVHTSAKELENQSDLTGFQKGASAEIGLLDVPESSSIISGLDDISIEATSFRQLQQVMEHLDPRTKLCIKDSLYRLARGAEQRHNHAGLSGSVADYGDTGGPLVTEGANRCTGFLDMETDTNPIDRSIAHLLFHRPSD